MSKLAVKGGKFISNLAGKLMVPAGYTLDLVLFPDTSAGGSGNATVNVTRLNGHNAVITLTSYSVPGTNITGSGTIPSGSSSGTIAFTVPSDTVDGNYNITVQAYDGITYRSFYPSINVLPTSILIGSNTQLLMHFDGTNGSTEFVDERGHQSTVHGNAAIDSGTKRFGSGSGKFLANGDFISISVMNDVFKLSGDFTVDGWFNWDSAPIPSGSQLMGIHSSGAGACWMLYLAGGEMKFFAFGAPIITAPFVPELHRWYHIAVVRSGSDTDNIKMYIDGAHVGLPATNTADIPANAYAFTIGGDLNGGCSLHGYADEIRISGNAAWTENFATNTVPYVLPERSSTPHFNNKHQTTYAF